MTVSVVIPNYNTWDLVERNVNALLHFDNELITEIIVVDDCSPTKNYISFTEKVKVLRNEKNLHYTGSVNVGLKACKGDIIVLLDSDAYPTHPFIQSTINLYKNNNLLGCVGFETVDENDRITGNSMPEPSILSLISGQQIHSKLRKYNVFASKNIMPFSCAVSFRKVCLDDIGFLDEAFATLDADQDISIRIHRSKWQLIYQPAIRIFHKGGGSISKNNSRVIKFYESRWQLLKKYDKIQFKSFVKLLITIRIYLEILIFTFKKNSSNKINTRTKLIELVSKW